MNNLDVQISLEALLNRPDFGPWPNLSKSLLAIGQTIDIIPDFEDIDNSGTFERDIVRSTILLDTYFQSTNNNATIDNGIVDLINQEFKIIYYDEDGNLPTIKQVQVCDEDGDNCDIGIDMIPSSHHYNDSIEYYIDYDFSLLLSNDYTAKFIFSDDNINNADYEITQFSVLNNQLGDVNIDSTIDVLDVVITIEIILEILEPTDIQLTLADLNYDMSIDVLDIIMIIDIILS